MTRHALVTGAAQGIGRDIAAALIDDGFDVTGIDINENMLANAAQALGNRFHAATADVTDGAAIVRVIDQRPTPLTAVINNAALVRAVPFAAMSRADWDPVIDINLTGAFNVILAAAPHLTDDGGRIINLSSHSGQRGNLGRVAYAASKGGLDALTRALAVELAPRGITVNAVAPGPVETPHSRTNHSAQRRKQWADRVPLGRYASSAEVTAAVRFLASPDAGFITGQILSVDGGFTIAGLTDTI